MKSPKIIGKTSVTVLSIALIFLCSAFTYVSTRSGFFGDDTKNISTLGFWEAVYLAAVPVFLAIASLYAASASFRTQTLCWLMLIIASLFTYSAIFQSQGADVRAICIVISYLIIWLVGVTSFLSALSNLVPAKKARYWGFLLFLFSPLIAFRVYGFSKELTWKMQNPSGILCLEVISGDEVWLEMGTPRITLERFGEVLKVGRPWCSHRGLSLNPTIIQAYSSSVNIEDQLSPMTIPLVANDKVCVGIFPDRNETPARWTTKIVNCNQLTQSHFLLTR